MRERVHSLLGGIAVILMMMDFILQINYVYLLGFSLRTFTLAIFIFIIRGPLLNAIFGPSKKKRKSPKTIGPEPTPMNAENITTEIQCMSCGVSNPNDSVFCLECGSSLKNTPVQNNMKK